MCARTRSLGDTFAAVVCDAEVELRDGISLLGRLAIPLNGFGHVLRDTIAAGVRESEEPLSLGVTLLGRLVPPLDRLGLGPAESPDLVQAWCSPF